MENTNQKALSHANPLFLRAEIETELRTRAYKDETFQQTLKSDPRGVLEREYPHWFPDGKIPQSFTIRIIEEEENSLNVVLLPKSASVLTYVEEESLASVQGGSGLSMLRGEKGVFRSETKHCTGGGASDACHTVECRSSSVLNRGRLV